MSQDNSLPVAGPIARLYIEAAETLQQHAPISDLAKSLCRIFDIYLQSVENFPPGELALSANHFWLLLGYLHTIDESFPENHTDFNGFFEECLERYNATLEAEAIDFSTQNEEE